MWPYTDEENDFVSKKNERWERKSAPFLLRAKLLIYLVIIKKGDDYE